MNKKFLCWLPGILGILFTLFISMFALDAFSEGTPFPEAVVGSLIHLLPTYIMIDVLLIAWKWGIFGGILFILAGASYMVWAYTALDCIPAHLRTAYPDRHPLHRRAFFI